MAAAEGGLDVRRVVGRAERDGDLVDQGTAGILDPLLEVRLGLFIVIKYLNGLALLAPKSTRSSIRFSTRQRRRSELRRDKG